MRQLLIIFCILSSGQLNAQRLVKDFSPGKGNCFINYIGNLDTGFVFSSYTPEYGFEPWISDGTENGTRLLKDILPGAKGSMVTDYFYEADSLIYFIAQDYNTYHLWRTNGTSNGTFKLFDFGTNIPSKYYKEGILYKGKLYFVQTSEKNRYLWSTDGTVAGTQAVYNFNDSGTQSIISLNEWKGQLYFFANDLTHGSELWTSDGTSSGTHLLKDIFPGTNSGINYGQTEMVGLGNQLFFTARSSEEQGYEIFSTDGTEAGTKLFKDLSPDTFVSTFPSLIAGNDSFFFINTTTRAWKSDGTIKNTRAFNIDPNDSLGYTYVYDAKPYKDAYLLYFYNNQNGTELYLCDGQFNKLNLIKDINPGPSSSYASELIYQKGGKAYFLAINNMLGSDIWVTDGTFDNTLLYLELTGTIGNEILINWQQRLFFVGIMDIDIGSELYEVVFNNSGIQKTLITSLDIYPNPTKAGSNITLNTPDDADVCLYNNSGQLVYQTKCTSGKIQLPELTAGVYTLAASNAMLTSHSLLVIE